MKSTTSTLSLLALAVALLLSVPASADTVTLTLTDPVQFGGNSLGSSLSFDATVTAPITNSADVFLNSANSVIAVLQPADQELRGPTEDLGVPLKQVKKFLVLR